MSVREIAVKHVRKWWADTAYFEPLEDMTERAIREAAKPLVEALERVHRRAVASVREKQHVNVDMDCGNIAIAAVKAWDTDAYSPRTCSACRHWDSDGNCMSALDLVERDRSDDAAYCDAALLATGPDFGCVKWEEKP